MTGWSLGPKGALLELFTVINAWPKSGHCSGGFLLIYSKSSCSLVSAFVGWIIGSWCSNIIGRLVGWYSSVFGKFSKGL